MYIARVLIHVAHICAIQCRNCTISCAIMGGMTGPACAKSGNINDWQGEFLAFLWHNNFMLNCESYLPESKKEE